MELFVATVATFIAPVIEAVVVVFAVSTDATGFVAVHAVR
jgi:hypothetical protein